MPAWPFGLAGRYHLMSFGLLASLPHGGQNDSDSTSPYPTKTVRVILLTRELDCTRIPSDSPGNALFKPSPIDQMDRV